MKFPIVTKEKQSLYEKVTVPLLTKNKNEYIPDICGFHGRACRQMGSLEGANRVLCEGCTLAAYCKTLTVKDIPLPEGKVEIYALDHCLGMMHTLYEGTEVPDIYKDNIVQHFNVNGNGTTQIRIEEIDEWNGSFPIDEVSSMWEKGLHVAFTEGADINIHEDNSGEILLTPAMLKGIKIAMEDYDKLHNSEKKSEDKNYHLILSNHSECDDLSVNSFKGTKQEAYKRMQAMVLATAAKTDVDSYLEVDMNSSEMTACIQWHSAHEDFRIVSLSDVTDISEEDGVADANLDAIPDDVSWDNADAHYALHDIGREEDSIEEIRVVNVEWDFDYDEVYEKLDNMTVSEAAETLGLPEEKYAIMTIPERHDYAYDVFRHNRKSLDDFFCLPSIIRIPDGIVEHEYECEEERLEVIADWLSDEYGFCHKGFDMVYMTNDKLLNEVILLKKAIIDAGFNAIEDFLGYKLDSVEPEIINSAIEEVLAQISDEDYYKYIRKYL